MSANVDEGSMLTQLLMFSVAVAMDADWQKQTYNLCEHKCAWSSGSSNDSGQIDKSKYAISANINVLDHRGSSNDAGQIDKNRHNGNEWQRRWGFHAKAIADALGDSCNGHRLIKTDIQSLWTYMCLIMAVVAMTRARLTRTHRQCLWKFMCLIMVVVAMTQTRWTKTNITLMSANVDEGSMLTQLLMLLVIVAMDRLTSTNIFSLWTKLCLILVIITSHTWFR